MVAAALRDVPVLVLCCRGCLQEWDHSLMGKDGHGLHWVPKTQRSCLFCSSLGCFQVMAIYQRLGPDKLQKLRLTAD